ncbi:MAG TPA: hypothetical protein VJ600_07235 [Holophagaceae bacterium]|nr:hypothetical protein [Holophagaceae bacterium]
MGLLLLSILLLLPGASNLVTPPVDEVEFWSSTKELIRLPISSEMLGKTFERKIRILPSRINGSGSLGSRHFQISVVSTGTTPYMQLWDDKAVQVQVTTGGRPLALKPVGTAFYLYSSATDKPTGLWFDPQIGDLCDVSIKIESNPFPSGCELVLAPSWDNPMFLKDRIVGSMLNPTFMKLFGWSQVLAMSLLGLCLVWLVLLSRRESS